MHSRRERTNFLQTVLELNSEFWNVPSCNSVMLTTTLLWCPHMMVTISLPALNQSLSISEPIWHVQTCNLRYCAQNKYSYCNCATFAGENEDCFSQETSLVIDKRYTAQRQALRLNWSMPTMMPHPIQSYLSVFGLESSKPFQFMYPSKCILEAFIVPASAISSGS